jgi:hypothetical protein
MRTITRMTATMPEGRPPNKTTSSTMSNTAAAWAVSNESRRDQGAGPASRSSRIIPSSAFEVSRTYS